MQRIKDRDREVKAITTTTTTKHNIKFEIQKPFVNW